MNQQIVYISGFPKSGTTHLTRLLGDTLNCPTGGSIKSQDKNEPAAGGFDRESNIIVRKGHFKIIQDDQKKAVIKPHLMNPDLLSHNEYVICLFRDPRDIAVSMSYYWGITVQAAVNQMIDGNGHSRFCGNWGEYVTSWLKHVRKNRQVNWIRYEDLMKSPEFTVERLLLFIARYIKMKDIENAIERNKIECVRERIKAGEDSPPLGKNLNLRLVRNGTPGEWRNHIGPKLNHRIYTSFDGVMKLLEYEV